MTVKQWLERGYKIDIMIKALEDVKEHLYAAATAATARQKDNKYHIASGHIDRNTDYTDISIQIDRHYTQLCEIKNEIYNTIQRLDRQDHEAAGLLLRRYIAGKRWTQICKEMKISAKYARRVHDRGIKKIKNFLKCP